MEGDFEGEHLSSTSKCRLSSLASSSALENLPAELRDQVLFAVPDLPTLRSFVRASPVMHAQYRSNRDRLLRACLDRELDGFFVDAAACVKSRAREMRPFRTDEKITDFLDTYHEWLSGPNPRAASSSVSPSNTRWLAGFHLTVARPLARRYSMWALANLTAHATSSSADGREAAQAAFAAADQGVTLSRSEEIRLYRALYRYETFSHLFGRNRGKRRGGFLRDQINELFFCLFDPWEVEAVGCIDLFIRLKYEDIFSEVKWDLDPANPRFEAESACSQKPQGSFDLEIEHDGE